MSAPRPDLTLIVPCFNEAARIPALLAALEALESALPAVTLEVLFVDDGSTDETSVLLAAACRPAARRVVTLLANQGKGAALRAGVAVSAGAVVLFFDADLAVDLSHVPAALALLEGGADVVVGCRNVGGAAVQRPQGVVRRTLGRGYRRLSSWWLDLRVADVTCGFKAFRGELGRRVFAASRCPRWGFDAEVLSLAQRQSAVIAELPVQWFDGEASAVRLFRDVPGALWELLRVRFRSVPAEAAAVGSAGTAQPSSEPGA